MTAPGRSCSSRNRRSAARAAGQARLLVLATDEPLVRPGRVEDLVELRLRHHVAAGVAVVEELDDLVHRRAVDERVMRRGRDPQDVGVLVLARAGQVRVDLAEAQAERLVDRAALGLDRGIDGREGRQPLLGGRRRSTPAPGVTAAAGRSSASSTNGETRRARAPP